MKSVIFLILCAVSVFASCNEQEKALVRTENAMSKKVVPALGDTVSELSKSIWAVFQDSRGNYWFGSDTDGVYCFNGKTAIHFSTKDGLSSNRVRGIQEDTAGNLYFTTLGGINKYDGKIISALRVVESDPQANNWRLVPGDLWFHTLGKNGEGGPCRYDGKELYQLKFPKYYMEDEFYKRSPRMPWSPYDVYYLYKDKRGTMWFGTSNLGLCRYDGKSFNWLYEDHLTNTPQGGSFGIRSILEDKEGKFWFCNTRYRFSVSQDSVEQHGAAFVKYEKTKGIEGLKSADGQDHIYFLSVVEDSTGSLWMLTYKDGVWKYDGKTVKHYPVKEGDKDIALLSIYKDRQGTLWLATQETGTYRFNGTAFERFKLH